MITEVKATRLGTIGKINVQVGSKISAGQELLTMETKKGNAVIKATANGIIESIEIEEGM